MHQPWPSPKTPYGTDDIGHPCQSNGITYRCIPAYTRFKNSSHRREIGGEQVSLGRQATIAVRNADCQVTSCESWRRACIIRDKGNERSLFLLRSNGLHCIIALEERHVRSPSERMHCDLIATGDHPKFYSIALTSLDQIRNS